MDAMSKNKVAKPKWVLRNQKTASENLEEQKISFFFLLPYSFILSKVKNKRDFLQLRVEQGIKQ
jgi:hypothetical protein